jgi:hypothetical protein
MRDREKLIELLLCVPFVEVIFGKREGKRYTTAWRIADHLIANGVTVRERGRWIQDGELDEDGNGQYHCSVCSAGETHNPIVDVPYCWKCGADMRGDEDGK